MLVKFEKLVEVDVREAWRHEAHDFTPWLFANLESLGEALGITLDPEGSEVAVQQYSADILARNAMDDSKVLIENQLGGSDHSHLGQIMTYLAGLEAKTVIWVATSFTPAHLSALKWLNDHTEEDFSFFAVRVKVVRIGDSPFAPVFEVLERPNEWEKQLHTIASKGGRSELSEQRFAFWDAYVKRIPGELEKNGPPSYWSNRWIVVDKLEVLISLYLSKTGVGLFLRAPHYGSDEATRNLLLSQELVLTESLGTPMGTHPRYFFGSEHKGNYNDLPQQDDLIDWLSDRASRYEGVLKKVFNQQ